MIFNYNLNFFNTAPTHLSGWESRVLSQRWCGASSVGLGASIFPHLLAQTLGPLGGGGATMDGPGWWRRSRGSREPLVLMPTPVIRMWLSVKLLGNLINLGQRNKCIHNWSLVKGFFHAPGGWIALKSPTCIWSWASVLCRWWTAEPERPPGGASVRGPTWWLVAGGQPGAFSTSRAPEEIEPFKKHFTFIYIIFVCLSLI